MLEIKENVALADHTVYKIGGPARFYVEVQNPEDLKEAVGFAKENNIPFFVLGAGSNVLISDSGFHGLVIRLSDGVVKMDGDEVSAGASLMMAQVVAKTAQAELAGFEWAMGVPGTIGGSVRGNAGCFGGEMKDVIQSVHFFDTKEEKFREFTNEECEFGYRHSIFKQHSEWIIVRVVLRLRKGDPKQIQEEIKRISLERSQKQDIGTKSCGCIFKNVAWARKDIDKKTILSRFPDIPRSGTVDGIPVSYLIGEAGLKGFRVGRVVVSAKHANFFVNEGGATAEEVAILIAIVKEKVRQKFGIWLEEEIQYVGF